MFHIFIQHLCTSISIFLGITFTAFVSAIGISKMYDIQLINPKFTSSKIALHKQFMTEKIKQLFITFLPIFQLVFLEKIHFTAHSCVYSVFLVTEYAVFIELFYYMYHYTLHYNNWCYQRIHKKHHENIDVYPFDSFYIGYFDLLGTNICLLMPLYLVPVNYYEFGFVMYFYTLSGILVHSDFFTKHHKIHHQYLLCNYGLVFPIFDNIFDTTRE